jgi:hypothetical protein
MHRVADCLQAAVRHQAARGADGAHIAAMAIATWRAVDEALSSIIGKSGFTALLRRSVFLTTGAYPWMSTVNVGDPRRNGLDTLHTTLAAQSGVAAAAANGMLLQTFCDLLSGLIGASLTDHLLQSARDAPECGHTDQEHSA